MPLSAPIRELMNFSSGMYFSVDGEGGGEKLTQCIIKGFASVATNDRSGDYTDPFEFNIDEFMAAPTLLINHNFWTDNWGNLVAIGRVLSAAPSKLVSIDGDSENWGIYDLVQKEVINKFPKSKVPALTKGDKGLFVTADVTVPEVVDQISKGQLSGMSWRGLVAVDYQLNNNITQRVLKDIDLYEISLVNIADHNQATFVVGKSVEGGKIEEVSMNMDDAQLWKVQLSKTKFVSKGMAEEYLKAHKLDASKCTEDKDSYVFEQRPFEGLNPQKLVRFKMGDAYMWMASPLEKPKGTTKTARLVAELVDVAKSFLLTKERNMADTKEAASTQAANTQTKEELEKIELEKKKKMDEEEAEKKAKMAKDPACKEAKQKTAEEQNLEVLGNHISASVAAALQPTLEKMAVGMVSVGDSLKIVAEKMAAAQSKETNTNTETQKDDKVGASKTEVAKAAQTVLQGIMDQLSNLAANQKATETKLVEVAKSAIELGKSIPNAELIRDEATKTNVQKSAISGKPVTEDPNSILDGAFPFLSGN